MNKEIEIPEGYTARIEGNKVILEQNDESIRNFLYEFIKVCGWSEKQFPPKEKVLAYLERQKEQKPMQFKGESLAEIIKGEFEGFRSLLKKKGIDYEPQSTYWEDFARLFDSSAREYLKEKQSSEWKPLPESMEALLFAIEGKWEMIKPTSYLSRRLEDLYEGLVNTYNVDETFLAELPKTDYAAKDIEELKALKRKIDASMDEKPAEWSEEDEKIRQSLISDLESAETEDEDVQKELNKQVAWLKSLRPSWKPSDEQMKALNEIINTLATSKHPHENDYLFNVLNGLRKGLKKLEL